MPSLPNPFSRHNQRALATFVLGLREVSVGVVAAVYLLLIPTAYSMYPELGKDQGWKIWVLVSWVLVAVVTTAIAALKNLLSRLAERRDKPLSTEGRNRLKLTTANYLLGLILDSAKAAAPTYNWTLFLWDRDSERLLPLLPERKGPDDIASFGRGQGATGTAFDRQAIVVATGDAVSDDTFKLTSSQQSAFAGYRSVVAAPVTVGDQVVGAIGAISREDDGLFTEDAGVALIRRAANATAEVLDSSENVLVPGGGG